MGGVEFIWIGDPMSYRIVLPSLVLNAGKFVQFAAAAIVLVYSEGVWAGDVQVNIDEARLIRLASPSAEVIVGNPTIADVSVQRSKVLVVTGKSFGLTNLIVLDDKGKEILNQKISVNADETRLVTLRKGVMRYSLHCTPICQSPLMVGDEAAYFENVSKATKTKFSAAETVMHNGQPGGE